MSKKDEVRALTKADPFLESLQKLGGFVRSHQTAVVASVVALLVLGGVVAYASNRSDKNAGAASKLLADAQKTFDKMPLTDATADVSTPPVEGDKEEKYATKDQWRDAMTQKLAAIDAQYPGSGAARVAKLYRASLALDAKKPDEAVAIYRDFLKESKANDPMAQSARLSLAAALEDQGKVDEAISELAGLTGKPADEKKPAPLTEEALLATARLQERAGKVSDARATYERIKTEFSASSGRFKAEQRLAALPKE
jgi:predicted negative regulator of RcsB-dependent stress response